MELNLTKSFIIVIKLIWSPYFGFWDTLMQELMKSSQETVAFLLKTPFLTTVLSSLLILIFLGMVFLSFAASIITICLVIIILIIEGGIFIIGSILLGLIVAVVFVFFLIITGTKSKIDYNIHIRSVSRHK